ncbi:MAG TPA: histidine kinase [Symbiobacteriaceae bacterium]|nr:histidine kinase [Symbiobacteriaceae bacterium]
MIKSLIAPLNNLRLRYKILLLCVSLVIFSSSLTGWYSYRTAAELVTENAYAQSRETVAQAANFLDEKLRNLLWVSFALQTDPSVQAVLADERRPYASRLSDVQSPLSAMRIRDRSIQSILISVPGADYFETVNILARPFRSTPLYEAARGRREFAWLPTHPDPLFRGDRPSLTLLFPVTVPADLEDAYIVVNLSADWFEQYLRDVARGRDATLLLVDAAGEPVLPTSAPLAAVQRALGHTQTVETDGLIINQAALRAADWRLVMVQPKAALLSGANAIQVAALAVMALSLAISGVLSAWLANSIARPLDRLRSLMRQIEHRNFTSTFKARYDDEIGDLGRAFNRMSGRLDELVSQVEAEQKLKRHAELRALQAQMNPHFLYNTLDSIYWKAQLQDHGAVSEMVVALSRLLRLGLNKGEEATTLARELEHTEIYLRLQKRNYEQQFDYTLDVDPECLEYVCPKLILQPIVENSLLHGFAGVTSGGQIHVAARLEANRVILTVSDNGCGMPDSVDALPKSGYALRNVQERIRLHFGPGYGLAFGSAPGGGALVTVTLPAHTTLDAA